MPQTHQTDPQNHIIRPVCHRCSAPMSLTRTEDDESGHSRVQVERPLCAGEWTLLFPQSFEPSPCYTRIKYCVPRIAVS